MIKGLYNFAEKWSEKGAIWIYADPHFEDPDCKLMDKNWITPEEQIKKINTVVGKYDTFICLGDIGNPEWIKKIHGYKVLICGNHDKGATTYSEYFDEIYDGPLMISDKIMLSHEPIITNYWFNIHGHIHDMSKKEPNGGLNVCSNIINYTPVNLGLLIKNGLLSDTINIHRMTIDIATIFSSWE